MKLREIAHSRTGDKGTVANISVIAYRAEDYPVLERYVTAERVKEHFRGIVRGEVERHALPRIGALNFLLRDALSGGVTRSLALDAHGKSLSSALLSLELPDAWKRSRAMADRIGRILVAALALWSTSAGAEVVRIDITSREPMNNGQGSTAGPFEILRGKAYGEIDPSTRTTGSSRTSVCPAQRARKGRVRATFALAKPIDLTRAARVLVYQVVNRGNGQAVATAEGYISLVSGWQGDVIPTPSNQTIVVPIAKRKDGSPVTGPVLGRFIDVPDGATTAQVRLASLQPYPPVDLAQPQATLTWHTSETYDGVQDASHAVPRADWAFADCSAATWPGTPDPSRICLKDGFRAGRIYELVYAARDPLVLGVGLAATRDVVSFFRHAAKDAAGTPNPVAGAVDHAISVGDSQSGNFIRTFIHLGFNQDERNRVVWDGAFPRIAARRDADELRFALPGGAAGMYEPGSDGVVWWTRYETGARPEGRGPARSLHGDEDLPEGDRSLRRGGVLGPAPVA